MVCYLRDKFIFAQIPIKDYETLYHFIIPGWFIITWIKQ